MYISDMAHFDEMDAEYRRVLLRPDAGAHDDPVRPGRLRRRGRRGRLARRLDVDVADARHAGRDGRPGRRRAQHRADAGLLRRARPRLPAAHQDAQAAGDRAHADARRRGRDHLPEARRGGGDGGRRARRHPAHVPARRRGEGRAARGARRRGRGRGRRRLGGRRARALAGARRRAGAEVGFLVEVDTGFARTGVQTPAEAADLAELADSLPGLRFDGPDDLPDPARHRGRRSARRSTRSASEGSRCARVSAGGTPTFFSNHDVPEVTEVRAGTYVYGDRSCIANGSVPLEDCALRIRATVVSRPTRRARHPRLRLEDADERPRRGGERRRPRPDRRVPRRAHLRALRGARPRRPRRVRGAAGGRRGRHRDPEPRLRLHEPPRRGRRAPRRPVVGFWPVAARGKLR